jgi:Tfp pilus assembly protein PilF
MDALKKAELAKNQARSGSADAPSETVRFPSLALEPIDNATPAGTEPISAKAAPLVTEKSAGVDSSNLSSSTGSSRLPELPTNLQGLDAQFIAHHAAQTSPPRAITQERVTPPDRPIQVAAPAITTPKARAAPPVQSTPIANDPDRAAARNLFETKETATPTPKRGFAIGVGVATLLAALGIGGYFWWQLQPRNSLGGGTSPSRSASPVVANVQSAPGSTVASATSTPIVANVPAPSAVSPAPTFVAAPRASSDEDDEDAKPARTKRPGTDERKPAVDAPDRATGNLIQTTKKPLQTNPVLANAYELFNRGDFTSAQKEYQRVLATEPQNIDALHGLAAIALKERRPETAEHFFQRILVADPRDAVAQSGLLSLRGNANPGGTESQLKVLAAAQPDLAAAQIALGNLYSTQNRWSDAQQAYFNAYASEPENPDLLFNLAISLEHLHKPALALQYYRLAIAAARQRPSGFDPAQAEERLRDLQP